MACLIKIIIAGMKSELENMMERAEGAILTGKRTAQKNPSGEKREERKQREIRNSTMVLGCRRRNNKQLKKDH